MEDYIHLVSVDDVISLWVLYKSKHFSKADLCLVTFSLVLVCLSLWSWVIFLFGVGLSFSVIYGIRI